MSDGVPRNPPRDRVALRTAVNGLCVALAAVLLIALAAWAGYLLLPTWARVLLLVPLFLTGIGAGLVCAGRVPGLRREYAVLAAVGVAMAASVFLGRALAYHSTAEAHACVVTASDSWTAPVPPDAEPFTLGARRGYVGSGRPVHLVEWDCAGTSLRLEGIGPADWDVGDEETIAHDPSGRLATRPADRAMGLATPVSVLSAAAGAVLVAYLPVLRGRGPRR